uniref:ion channel n=1 Tax=uncultured Lactobacillus sp. TaxID=153152 RepID=UPI002621A8FA
INIGFWMYVDNIILVIFAIDYFSRLFLAKDKKKFFKENIFDLLSIIPVSGLFAFFRIARISRAARLVRLLSLFRLVGLAGKLKKFLHTNGLIYWIYLSLALLIIGAGAYSISEDASLGQSFWWAIATATTVGYGDISPHTLVGKIVAFILMLVGIGVIGMLTSSITTYFVKNNTDESGQQEKLDQIIDELRNIKDQNAELKNEIEKLKQRNQTKRG